MKDVKNEKGGVPAAAAPTKPKPAPVMPGLERNDVGLQVLYRLPDFPKGTARLRHAVVTQDFGTAKNLRVTLDLANDLEKDRPLGSCAEDGTVTSALEGKDVGQFKPNRLYIRA